MSPANLRNKIATFHPDLSSASTPVVGQIIGIKANPDRIRGDIPDQLATLRGRSGQQITISVTDSYLRIFPTWKEALASIGTK